MPAPRTWTEVGVLYSKAGFLVGQEPINICKMSFPFYKTLFQVLQECLIITCV